MYTFDPINQGEVTTKVVRYAPQNPINLIMKILAESVINSIPTQYSITHNNTRRGGVYTKHLHTTHTIQSPKHISNPSLNIIEIFLLFLLRGILTKQQLTKRDKFRLFDYTYGEIDWKSWAEMQ